MVRKRQRGTKSGKETGIHEGQTLSERNRWIKRVKEEGRVKLSFFVSSFPEREEEFSTI